MPEIKCVVCNKVFVKVGNRKTCSSECSNELKIKYCDNYKKSHKKKFVDRSYDDDFNPHSRNTEGVYEYYCQCTLGYYD